MFFKMNSVFRFRLFIIFLTIVILVTFYRFYHGSEPPPLTRTELAEDGVSTIVTFLPVSVEVYYEALCPDSRSFLLTQLLPTYLKIAGAMNVHLIPYGKAKTFTSGNSFKFECQHGPPECLANKVHACGIDLISDPKTLILFATCMIEDNWNAEEAGSKCAKKHGIEWSEIWACARGTQGNKLLALYGKKTDKLGYIDFIPTIALQGSTAKQPAILKNLLKEICLLYKDEKPEGCPNPPTD